MPVTKDSAGPYTSPTAVLEIVGRYRSRGLSVPIDGDVLRKAGISESLVPRTLQSLQSLDLIGEDGMPTDTFENIRKAPEDEYKQRLADWVKGTYADVFAFVDPATEPARVRDAFRSYKPVGQQERMVTLFLGLATAAGLIEGTKKPASPRVLTPRPARPRPPGHERRARFPDRSSMVPPPSPSDLPPPVVGLLSSLPPTGEGWTKDERDKFLTTFGVVLDFCFPVVKQRRDVSAIDAIAGGLN